MKEVKGEFLGHQIAATFAVPYAVEAKLYIDGKVADTAHARSKKYAILRGSIVDNNKTYIVEIFLLSKGWWKSRLAIFVDGKKIA
jgi:hypothetical protein